MTPVHVLLSVLVAIVWGVAFVATKIALDSFSAPQLTALRFLIAALPVIFLSRPTISWPILMLTGLTLFAGQFLFQFFGMVHGMRAGLASILVQTQAFFTIIFAAVALRERPTRRQLAGVTVALVGLVGIGATVGDDLTLFGFCLTLMSAISWGIGNVFLKRLPPIAMLNLVAWLSLIPPLPSLALAIVLDGPAALVGAASRTSWLGRRRDLPRCDCDRYSLMPAVAVSCANTGRPRSRPSRSSCPLSRLIRPPLCSASDSGRFALPG